MAYVTPFMYNIEMPRIAFGNGGPNVSKIIKKNNEKAMLSCKGHSAYR